METVLVYINKQDIAEGNRLNSTSCPIARAATRKFGRATFVGMSHANQWEDRVYGKLDAQYSLDAAGLRFREDFDAGRPVKPGHIRLRRVK